jgi:hypothetical protein
VTVTVTDLGSPIEGVSIGDTTDGNWLLSTDCAARPCSLRLIGATFFGAKIDASGPFQGRTFNGDAESALECTDTASGTKIFDFEQTSGQFTVHVTDVRRVAGVPQATAFKGSFDFTWVPPPGQSQPGCEETTETDTFEGTIRETQAPEPLPPGAPTPPVSESAVIGTWDTTFDVVKANNIGDKDKGDQLTRVFSFIPKCRAATGCPLTLIRERSDGIGQDKLLPKPDGSYAETLDGTFDCGDGTADYTQTLTLKIDDAQLVAGVWRATGMQGTFEYQSTPSPGTKGCKPQHELDLLTATAQI